METIIKVNPSELDVNLLNKIREFIGDKTNINVTISLKEIDASYVEELNDSIKQAEASSNLISFTMEEFMKYEPAK